MSVLVFSRPFCQGAVVQGGPERKVERWFVVAETIWGWNVSFELGLAVLMGVWSHAVVPGF